MKPFTRIIALALALTIFAGSARLTVCTAAEAEYAQAEETTAPTAAETEAADGMEPTDAAEPEDAGQPEETPEETETIETEAAPEETEEATIPEEPEETVSQEEVVPGCTVDMPAYLQENYPDVPFGSGSVATDGSSVTALAMAASYLTGRDYTPDVLAGYFANYAGDDSSRLEQTARELGLNCRRAADFQDTYQSLESGCVAICKMGGQSVFTGGVHWIVLKEVTPDGRIYVNDPLGSNQEKDMLREGFERGFPKGWISTGWEGAWILDPKPAVQESETHSPEKERVMPLYNQMDYADVRYGAGTVATSGCGITSLAMVATYMTGHTYYPDELADYFGGYNGNNIERLLNASDELQLPWQKAENWHVARKALGEGKIVILLMSGRSMFSNSQHFMVATGLTEDGKVKINDPYGPNYNNPVLKDGFANGFTSSQIATGYSGSWIYDVYLMPEEPFIYVE